jgi:diguanylate cyclase (GGDEF)-like protein
VLYIDLDKFKQVNDNFGHDTGDLLLCEVARRINECVRESDTVGRVGGDEFVVLLNSIKLSEHASAVAEKIRQSLDQPFDLAGRQLSVSSSIGIAIYPEHGEEDRQLMRHADDAMYGAKRQGGNRLMVTVLQALHDDNAIAS